MARIGVLGVGSMGQNHARVYSEIADLVGVLDLDPVTGKQVARRLGTTYYDDLDVFLGEVEAISVCTPTERHFDVAWEAIERGVHVLLEKPFTGSSDKARDLCLLA